MTNVLQDAWGGWIGFWKDVVGNAPSAKPPIISPAVNSTKTGPKTIKPPIKKVVQKPEKSPKPPTLTKAERAEEKALEVAVDPPVKFKGVKEEWLESPEERANRIRALQEKKRRTDNRSKEKRQLLWLNPGDLKLAEAKLWLKGSGPRPAWTNIGLSAGFAEIVR